MALLWSGCRGGWPGGYLSETVLGSPVSKFLKNAPNNEALDRSIVFLWWNVSYIYVCRNIFKCTLIWGRFILTFLKFPWKEGGIERAGFYRWFLSTQIVKAGTLYFFQKRFSSSPGKAHRSSADFCLHTIFPTATFPLLRAYLVCISSNRSKVAI